MECQRFARSGGLFLVGLVQDREEAVCEGFRCPILFFSGSFGGGGGGVDALRLRRHCCGRRRRWRLQRLRSRRCRAGVSVSSAVAVVGDRWWGVSRWKRIARTVHATTWILLKLESNQEQSGVSESWIAPSSHRIGRFFLGLDIVFCVLRIDLCI